MTLLPSSVPEETFDVFINIGRLAITLAKHAIGTSNQLSSRRINQFDTPNHIRSVRTKV
jgi:hypothetical protein